MVDTATVRDRNPLCEVDRREYAVWASREGELAEVAGQLLDSPALHRLGNITFLGILSPRFAREGPNPLWTVEAGAISQPQDGSRRSHSVGVALIALDLCRYLEYSSDVQRYAVAWGLLHDLGNWALAHTGEYAFARVTGSATKQVRDWLITGDSRAPAKYSVRDALVNIGIEPARLVALLRGEPDAELSALSTLIRSPLTPDMLEGMWRAGRVFNVKIPRPSEFYSAIRTNQSGLPYLRTGQSDVALGFWQSKATIYDRFFNDQRVALWESSWSVSILDAFEGTSLHDSLDVSEHEVIQRTYRCGLRPVLKIHRWKPPSQYSLYPQTLKRLGDTQLDRLSESLVEK